jgi:cell division protein ZipA
VVETFIQPEPLVKADAELQSEDEPVAETEPGDLHFSAKDDDDYSEQAPVIPWEDDIGPARVVSPERVNETLQETPAEKIHDLDIPQSPLIPKARPVNLDEEVPVLLDVEELGEEDPAPVYATAEERAGVEAVETVSEELVVDCDGEVASPGQDSHLTAPEQDSEQPSYSAEYAVDDTDPHLEREVEEIPENLVTQPVNFADPSAESLDDRAPAELVLEIHCIAHDPVGFAGKDILFLFNSCDLRFGEKQIFHRFEEADGKGTIQFSVAQSYEPGIFVPAAMAQQHFRGLSFFLSLPGAKKPLEAYEAMSEMALVVARKLRADLYDSARSALTPQTIEHDRQQIMDYERRQKLAQKKQARR